MKGACSIPKKKLIQLFIIPIAALALLYGSGYLSQLFSNYRAWQEAGAVFGTSPTFPDAGFFPCLAAAFHFPYGLYGLGLCIGALALLILMVMRMGYSEGGEYDRQRNLVYSDKGTYGTAGFMSRKELTEVLDLVPDIRKHSGTILGELDHQVICIPPKTRFNGNLAVYGASGSKKTRAFCVNMILQCAARKSSLVICDPKSELYEKTSEYLRDQGYTVRVFNLVTPSASDSWNCLAEIGDQELMAQLFCDVIIKNTGGEERDHFWDSAEMNLLKALVLYVSTSYPKKKQNIGEVYQLLTASSEKELNALFDVLPLTHPAKAPYSIFKQASEGVRGGVIIGLGSRLQVFQNRDIRNITSYNEIDLELPGKQPCAYYCITSDQDSTFDFLSSLFLSFVFIRLVRYADEHCPGGALPVPVHVLGEELCACGVIPDLSRKISVIRSRNLSMSCVFQNLAGLQNRYPYNQWQEILGNCDVQLFLGCTDALTAEFISDRTGEASISVTSKAKQLGTWRVCKDTCAGTDIITRGEAADLLYTLLTREFTVAPPPILETLPLNNKEGVHLNSYLLELQKIPEPIRQAFAEKGWQYMIDYEYLASLSDQRNLNCIGVTDYENRQIVVSSAEATVHEFGHFLDKLMGFPSQTEGFYKEESGTAAALLRPYALTSEREYFADCFVYWLTYRDNSKKMAALCSAAPKTYAYLLTLEIQNWQPAA